jgi:glutamyl endopeptidase
MKPKTLSGKNGNGNSGTETLTKLPKTHTQFETTEPKTDTELENVAGAVLAKPGEADKEVYNRLLETETELEEEVLEESGTEEAEDEAGEDLFTMDALFASYPELLDQARAEVIIGVDSRVRITPTTTFPWRAICALKIKAQNNTNWIGTGWLISPRTVITAGHCVYMHAQGGWVKSIKVIPAMDGTIQPYNSCTGTTFRSVVGWVNSKQREYDYGAIILPQNCRPGAKTGVFGFGVRTDAYLKAAFLNLSGYPGDKGGNQQWFMGQTTKSVAARVIYYEIDTMGGQSGAPVWVKVGNVRTAVGIHTNGHLSGNSATRIVAPVFNNLQAWKALGA